MCFPTSITQTTRKYFLSFIITIETPWNDIFRHFRTVFYSKYIVNIHSQFPRHLQRAFRTHGAHQSRIKDPQHQNIPFFSFHITPPHITRIAALIMPNTTFTLDGYLLLIATYNSVLAWNQAANSHLQLQISGRHTHSKESSKQHRTTRHRRQPSCHPLRCAAGTGQEPLL